MQYPAQRSHLRKTSMLPGFLLGLLLIGHVGLLACGVADIVADILVRQPTPPPGILEKPAPIESVTIEVSDEVSETGVKIAELVVVSGLPNACYTFGHYGISREGNNFLVEIVNMIPDDPRMACAEIYGMVTNRIPLPGHVELCASYPVIVNGELHLVPATAPNVRCADPSGAGKQDLRLVFGEKAMVRGTDLELTLVEVTEDSRCPSDVVCVWAGRATAIIMAELSEKEIGRVSLTLGAGEPGNLAAIANYNIELISLDPYPVSIQEISTEDYRARVAIGTNYPPEDDQKSGEMR